MGLAAIDMSKGFSGQFIRAEDVMPEQKQQLIELYIKLLQVENDFLGEETPYADEDAEMANEFLATISELYILTNFGSGRIIGFMALDYGDPNDISSFFVEEECRSSGFGSIMLVSAINRDPHSDFHVYCYAANKRAQKFYETHGFVFEESVNAPGVNFGVKHGRPRGTIH